MQKARYQSAPSPHASFRFREVKMKLAAAECKLCIAGRCASAHRDLEIIYPSLRLNEFDI